MASRVPDTIKRGPLSPEEIAQIAKLGDLGWIAGRIAQKLNRHPGTVSYAMHRLGVRTLQLRSFSYMRGGVLVKSFSAEEDAYLTGLRISGMSTPKIARAITAKFGHTRSAHTIQVRLVLLSNLDEAA